MERFFQLEDGGVLIIGSQSISTWKTDKWPFKMIKSREATEWPAEQLVALSSDVFASAINNTVTIWAGSDLKMLHEIKVKHIACKLKALGDDTLLIYDDFHFQGACEFLFYNFRSGEILKQIRITLWPRSMFVTPDREFLVMVGKQKALFYHLLGGNIYSAFETTQCHQFQSERVQFFKGNKFASLDTMPSKILIFDFRK